MNELNINARILMFAACTSIEYDLRKYIVENSIHLEIASALLEKAKSRNKSLKGETLDSNNISLLVELDMGDLIQILISNPFGFGLNHEKTSILKDYFDKIIPIRNRVMHTRPLEVGDRSLLTEVLNTIATKMPWIQWNETFKTRENIRNKPHEIFSLGYKKIIEYESNVYHNLPEPEFDDTGYIGRKQEIKEIIKLLKDKKNQIITIVGNGGIGKTATAVKTLYDLIDDMENKFESVIWVSLKTKTLSQGEFTNIKDSIKDLSMLFSSLEEMVVKEDKHPKDNILEFMTEFNTLLVLDNLETISTPEIISFLKEIPENSKVLITSRHGLGELEYRYSLGGLDLKDAIIYFRLLSQHYNLNLHMRKDKDLKKIITESLYSSPLSIKWFISSIFTGVSEQSILANKDDLIVFCMSNVVDKLTIEEKKILQLLLVEGKKLSHGEIDFFLQYKEDVLVKSLNKLVTTSMIQLIKGVFELNQMAKDYLSLSHPPSNEFIIEISKKRSSLNIMMQEIKVKNENDPFNPKSLYKNLESNNNKIASYYLMQALEFSSKKKWEEAFSLIKKATNIVPDYFEVYKIKAFISAENEDWYDAINSYRTALESCETDIEKASVLFLFSIFYTVRMNNFEEAKVLIIQADEIYPNNNNIQIEKARVLTYLGEFQEAEKLLESISVDDNFTEKSHNQFIIRFADLYRRMAETLENRDHQKKLALYKLAVSKIESLDRIDKITYRTLGKILLDLSFLYRDSEAMLYLKNTLEKHLNSLIGLNGTSMNGLYRNIHENRYDVSDELYFLAKKVAINYTHNARLITEKNKGMIVKIIGTFGFTGNQIESIYFSLSQITYKDPDVGDIVSYDVGVTQRGPIALNIKLVKRFEII